MIFSGRAKENCQALHRLVSVKRFKRIACLTAEYAHRLFVDGFQRMRNHRLLAAMAGWPIEEGNRRDVHGALPRHAGESTIGLTATDDYGQSPQPVMVELSACRSVWSISKDVVAKVQWKSGRSGLNGQPFSNHGTFRDANRLA